MRCFKRLGAANSSFNSCGFNITGSFESFLSDGVLVQSHQPVVIAQSVHHVFKTASRGGLRIACQANKVFVDLFGVDLFWQFSEVNYKQGNTADVII